MRYKAQYEPSDLLCPVTYQWVPYAECVPTLNRTRFARLAPPGQPKRTDMEEPTRAQRKELIESATLIVQGQKLTIRVRSAAAAAARTKVGELLTAQPHTHTQQLAQGANVVQKCIEDFVTRAGLPIAKRLQYQF